MTAVIVAFDKDSIARAKSVLMEGGLIVYPSDTVYGLGCDPVNNSAVNRLVEAKRREERPISVLCSSTSAASELVELNRTALELTKKFWPGALTIVAPLKRSLPLPIHRGTGTLGVRVPAMPLCVALIEACGGWLTGTSANLSGSPSARTAEEASNMLGDKVDLILDRGRLEGLESTVVRVIGDSVEVLRVGPVGISDEKKKQ